MKKIIILLSVLTVAMTEALGQSIRGDFTPLQSESKVQIQLDYSKADIHGMTEDDFAVYEEDWNEDKPEIISKFVTACNKGIGHAPYLIISRSTPYILKVDILTIFDNGDCILDASLINPEGLTIGTIENVRGEGGRFGTKLNLIKDGSEDSGLQLGRLLKKAMKKRQ